MFVLCIEVLICWVWTTLVAQIVKSLPAVLEAQVWSLGWEDSLEKEMETHSSILVWKIPWTEEPGRLQFMGSQRVRHDWVTSLHFINVGCIDTYNCYVFLLDWSLDHYVVSFLISCNFPNFKVYFVLTWGLLLQLSFVSHFHGIYFSILSLSVYMCLQVWSGFLVDSTYMGLCIHSASLCLLAGAFNPFTFKVIIDIYIPIAIFLIVWGWFCRCFYFSYISWLYKSI